MADLPSTSGSPNGNSNLPKVGAKLGSLPSLCRGLYNRVAQKLGCDPSYVSRVARGQRTSHAISEALRAEVQQTWAMAIANETSPSSDAPPKPLKRKSR